MAVLETISKYDPGQRILLPCGCTGEMATDNPSSPDSIPLSEAGIVTVVILGLGSWCFGGSPAFETWFNGGRDQQHPTQFNESPHAVGECYHFRATQFVRGLP